VGAEQGSLRPILRKDLKEKENLMISVSYENLDDYFNELDKKINSPEGKLKQKRYAKKQARKSKTRVARLKTAVKKWKFEIESISNLPLEIVTLIDEYLFVRCPNCKTNVFPYQLYGWNVSSWNDTFELLKEAQEECTRQKIHCYHSATVECLVNKFETINDQDGGPTFLMHLQVWKMNRKNRLVWSINLKRVSLNKTSISQHPFSRLEDVTKEQRDSDCSRWSSITMLNENTMQILKFISMNDKMLTESWRGLQSHGHHRGRMISSLRSTLISNLESLFD
jgi:hypothetical protein